MAEITHQTLHDLIKESISATRELTAEFRSHKQLVEGAFPVDERGLPDYGQHKTHHQAIAESDRAMGEYKRAITMRLLQGAVGLLITILGFGLGPYFSKILGGVYGG